MSVGASLDKGEVASLDGGKAFQRTRISGEHARSPNGKSDSRRGSGWQELEARAGGQERSRRRDTGHRAAGRGPLERIQFRRARYLGEARKKAGQVGIWGPNGSAWHRLEGANHTDLPVKIEIK